MEIIINSKKITCEITNNRQRVDDYFLYSSFLEFKIYGDEKINEFVLDAGFDTGNCWLFQNFGHDGDEIGRAHV